MNEYELERRQARAESETYIIARTEEGFRISSPSAPANQYVVSGIPEEPRCTCPDFQHHAEDIHWRCKHILAVQNHLVRQNHAPGGNGSPGVSTEMGNPSPTLPPEQRKTMPRSSNGGAQMLIKRSMSPDGRIDSLSVEFSCPVGKISAEEIKARAEKSLKLQGEIMESFMKDAGRPNGPAQSKEPDMPDAVPGQMLAVAGMNSKWGRRLFINVSVNGQVLKFFGTQKQLAETVGAAGFASMADHLSEGMQLNLPCRVVTKPSSDGKYLNVERVLSAQAPNAQQRAHP